MRDPIFNSAFCDILVSSSVKPLLQSMTTRDINKEIHMQALFRINMSESENADNSVWKTQDVSQDVSKISYAKKKTLSEGLLDVGLLIANASQLKALLSSGSSLAYFWPVLILLILSLVVQLAVGVLLLILGLREGKCENDERCDKINNAVTILIFITIVFNIFIGAFGVEICK